MKLFEYMATGKPVVATRLHSIEEVVNEQSAFLVPADDANALAEGIRSALSSEGPEKSLRAKEIVREHTWNMRAGRILHFVTGSLTSL